MPSGVHLVAETDDAVAVVVTEPADSAVRVSFREGGRRPLGRGAAGYALLTALPPRPGEDPRVTEGRGTGYVISLGEVMQGYWGLGVPLARAEKEPPACLTIISASKRWSTVASTPPSRRPPSSAATPTETL